MTADTLHSGHLLFFAKEPPLLKRRLIGKLQNVSNLDTILIDVSVLTVVDIPGGKDLAVSAPQSKGRVRVDAALGVAALLEGQSGVTEVVDCCAPCSGGASCGGAPR